MLRKLGIVAGVLVGLVIVIIAFASTKPDTFQVQRSLAVKAPPEKIAPLITDFHAWTGWSPWEKLDPGMKRTYEGAPSGKGAGYGWEGKDDVGSGHMEITDVTPNAKVAIKLDFIKPFEAHNVVNFTLEPAGDSTKVTWTMLGPANLMTKVMHLFLDMDKLVGQDFETGLANLKALAEK